MLSYCKEKLHTDQSTVTNLSSHHDILDEPYPELKEPILDVRSMACRPIGTIWFRNSSIFSSYIWRCLSKAPTKSRPKEVKYWLKWGEILANLAKPFARPTWRGNFKTAMMHLNAWPQDLKYTTPASMLLDLLHTYQSAFPTTVSYENISHLCTLFFSFVLFF